MEILVVIVILAVGILAMVQIFPGGLRILALNRNAAVASRLARGELERVIARVDQLPEQILPVTYIWDSGTSSVQVSEDDTRTDGNLGPVPGTIDAMGNVIDADGHNLGYWPYLSGPNLFRRVVGEGGRVPAPRQVGDFYGGLMVLQFAPIIFNSQDPGRFQIYGADLARRTGLPLEGAGVEPYEFYAVDAERPEGKLILPADTARSRSYRLVASFYTTDGTTSFKRSVVDHQIDVPPSPTGYAEFALDTLDDVYAGENFQGAEPESVRVARHYEKIPTTGNFSDAYEYKLLDPNLGLILFSNLAYNTFELRNGRRVPLQARVNYDVFDWRIIRDEFRVPEGENPQAKLVLGNIKVKGNRDVDGTEYLGLNLNVPTGTGTTERRDLVLMDMETGGILLPASATSGRNGKELYRVDKSYGQVSFFDADGDTTNGMTGEVVFPGLDTPTDVNMTGRPLRAMYQGVGEWSVQVLKAPSIFTQSVLKPGIAQFYVGGSDAVVGGSTTRIYLPLAEAGRRITVDEIWYRRPADASPRLLENQSFVVQSQPADATGLAYIDVKSVDPLAQEFDTDRYGYAVRGVRGATVSVRVLWNPSYLSFTTDGDQNVTALETWARDWRRTTDETFLRRPPE